MLLAVGQAALSLGVDVERIRADAVVPGTPAWPEQPVTARPNPETFLRRWTATEALLKAYGCGLAGLDRVDWMPGFPLRLRSFDGSAAEAARWWFGELRPRPGFVGAVACRR